MNVERSSGYAPGFDLRVVDGDEAESEFTRILSAVGGRLEVKNDLRSRETENVAVEFRQHGRASGIAVTTAEWWALRVQDGVWVVIETGRLKRLARLFWNRRRPMGDNGNEGVLIPRCALLDDVPDEPLAVAATEYPDEPDLGNSASPLSLSQTDAEILDRIGEEVFGLRSGVT